MEKYWTENGFRVNTIAFSLLLVFRTKFCPYCPNKIPNIILIVLKVNTETKFFFCKHCGKCNPCAENNCMPFKTHNLLETTICMLIQHTNWNMWKHVDEGSKHWC